MAGNDGVVRYNGWEEDEARRVELEADCLRIARSNFDEIVAFQLHPETTTYGMAIDRFEGFSRDLGGRRQSLCDEVVEEAATLHREWESGRWSPQEKVSLQEQVHQKGGAFKEICDVETQCREHARFAKRFLQAVWLELQQSRQQLLAQKRDAWRLLEAQMVAKQRLVDVGIALDDQAPNTVFGQPVRTVPSAATAAPTVVPVAAPNQLTMPAHEGDFCRHFIRQAMASDALLRQMSPSKRVALQLLDLYAQTGAHDAEQFEFFKKAYSTMCAQAAMSVVRRFYGEATDPTLERAAAQIGTLEASMPELEQEKQKERADEALCLFHLHNACRRVGVKPLTRAGFSALYLAEYAEVRERFAGKVRVTRDEIRKFLQDEAEGCKFWLALCARCGLPVKPYDPQKYQIEHILNGSWGGADHYINFMVLQTLVNNAAEFRYGPGEVKMITLGLAKYQLVQRFARWIQLVGKDVPRDAFWKIEAEYYSLPPISITGSRQLQLRECVGGKRQKPND